MESIGSPFTLMIDWLAFTVPDSQPQDAMEILGGDWSRAKAGFRGYPISWITVDGLRGVGKLGATAIVSGMISSGEEAAGTAQKVWRNDS